MKLLVYRLAKALGLFGLTRRWFRKRLLILCYHGFETRDEAAFMPGVFMRRETFARRLEILRRGGFRVLPLDEALERLRAGTLPENSVCLTLDDGFHSVKTVGAPLLGRYGYPSTLYVTTYYVHKGSPIFRLAVQYMFWKAEKRVLTLDRPAWGVGGRYDLRDPAAADALCWRIIDFGERHGDEPGRQRLCRELAALLDVDYEGIVASRGLSLLDWNELRELQAQGVDIQLHTHRHRTPADRPENAQAEIIENARLLAQVNPGRLRHFCYPSGQWQPEHLRWLGAMSLVSATTCDAGMNTADTHPLALYRALDSEDMPELFFEAELCGFNELLRIISGRRRRSDARRRLDGGGVESLEEQPLPGVAPRPAVEPADKGARRLP